MQSNHLPRTLQPAAGSGCPSALAPTRPPRSRRHAPDSLAQQQPIISTATQTLCAAHQQQQQPWEHQQQHAPLRGGRRQRPVVHCCSVTQQAPGVTHAEFTLQGTESPQEVLSALQQATQQALPLSPGTTTALEAALTPASLASLKTSELPALLTAVAGANSQPLSTTWLTATLNHVSERVTSQMSDDDMPQLAGLLWAVSELGAVPEEPFFKAVTARLAGGVSAGGLYATDLCTMLCALGCLKYKPDAATTAVIVKEVQLQLKEFLSDFGPLDVAKLATGVADLGLSKDFPPEFQGRLMKAVYSKVRTIEDKAAVDFALAKLEAGERSMHYDPRWTHEELHWLPRHERDKRRIIAENYSKSQWGGYKPGRD